MLNYLILFAAVMLIIVCVQAARVTDMLAEIRGDKEPGRPTKTDNKWNAILMMAFLIGELGFIVYQLIDFKKFLLPKPASAHGAGIDMLMDVNMLIIFIVFFVTQILLFWFAYKYKGNKDARRGEFYPDNHRLEVAWTVVPAVVMVALIWYGLNTWNDIVKPAETGAMKVELYAKQFDWTVRYGGKDGQLGRSYYKLISDNNVVGLDSNDVKCDDDIVTKELHLPVNREIDFVFHSRDVIHSAYMPHFRAQMNCVPGMDTKFHFKPIYTTSDMRRITKNDAFDYVVLCNKVCGVAHFNMSMKLIVETEKEYAAWLAKQKTYSESRRPVPQVAPAADSTTQVKNHGTAAVSTKNNSEIKTIQ